MFTIDKTNPDRNQSGNHEYSYDRVVKFFEQKAPPGLSLSRRENVGAVFIAIFNYLRSLKAFVRDNSTMLRICHL
jgi:hypothetical protein